MNKPKKLIEVAMPIKEISAESVRDKSIRKGHISTLHLWWARRPLPTCRAVVFASLVPDPLDKNCPSAFREAVNLLLGKNNDILGDPYKPYSDIPHTTIVDEMEDNLRNRLLMFIGKFSKDYIENEKKGRKTPPKKAISPYSLIKWENRNNPQVIERARKLIYVSHNFNSGKSAKELIEEFISLSNNVNVAENKLYKLLNRHLDTEELQKLTQLRDDSINAFLSKMPKVFDPFAGGGAIPLEISRLGCNSFGNDINPVAHIIQLSGCTYPQKYGKPISFTSEEFLKIYDKEALEGLKLEGVVFGNQISVNNRLAFDVEYFSNKLILEARKKIGENYNSRENAVPYIYYWARKGKCSNPSCAAEVPLLNKFYVSKKRSSSSKGWVYLEPVINGKELDFKLKRGTCNEPGWVKRKNLKCPICENITDVNALKEQFSDRAPKKKLLCIVEDVNNERVYRLPTKDEENQLIECQEYNIPPFEKLPVGNSRDLHCMGWGINRWGDVFTNRQVITLNCLVEELENLQLEDKFSEYGKAIKTYLSILINRVAARGSSLGVWHILQETVEHPFGRHSLPMKFDFPEINPFTKSSGGIYSQLTPILEVIKEESSSFIASKMLNASSGEKDQFLENELDAVVTDPPYYDAIAYADLADFFYVWFKRTLSNNYPLTFPTPLTPKQEECTALKHHHGDSIINAKRHFEEKLRLIFTAIEFQTEDIVSIMFAHQSTEAWTLPGIC